MGLAILFSTTGEIAFRGSTTWMSHAEEHWDVSTAPWTKGNTMALRHMRLVGESKRVEADPNEIDRFGRRLDRRSQRCRRAKALSSLLICQSFSKFRSSEGCGAGRFFSCGAKVDPHWSPEPTDVAGEKKSDLQWFQSSNP